MEVELTVSDYLDMVNWWQSLPPGIRELVRHYPPGSKWQLRNQGVASLAQTNGIPIRSGDYFCPENFTSEGQIEMRLVSGETGQPLSVTCIVRQRDLIPAGN